MKLLCLLRRVALEADGAAVGGGGGLAIDRLADAEHVAASLIEEPHMTGRCLVARRGFGAEDGKYGIVKTL